MTSTNPHQEYELLSSTRFDPFLLNIRWNDDKNGPSNFLLLRYHFDRLIAAVERHDWFQAKSVLASYNEFESLCRNAVEVHRDKDNGPGALKLRFTLSQSGKLTVTTSAVSPLSLDPSFASSSDPLADDHLLSGPIFSIFLSSAPCPSSIFTFTKTTYRSHYDDARRRVNLPPVTQGAVTAEVLLYNEVGLITEASIYNVAVYRGHQWLTPSSSTGCLPGVFRRWLLERGQIHEDKEGHLTKDSIKEGEWVLLFNAVHGCQLGRMVSGVYSE
ncbi:Putative aminodeoxychorismate lyase [Termitomyces sp. J132]|nr:hypothetical protein H2248_001232 [Termitomyces sp. 'cryptogamus']KNZ80636.1 Putative aminodeoxychorismate lyase [Termitomyces sp. J132]